MYCLGELADQLDLKFSGDASREITGLATLETAGPADMAFMDSVKYLSQLARTRAAAVILAPEFVDQCPVDCLISASPYLAFARASNLFDRSPPPPPGVHSSAVVAADAQVHASASVGPNAVIEAGAVLAAGAVVGANVYLGHNSRLGAATRVFPSAVIYHDVHVGEGCVIHSQSVLGADGFGFAPGPAGWEKICQLGGVRIGDRVEIGACTTVDRGALDHTVIEDGVIIDNQVQIAHNCRIGKNTAIAGCTGLAGSTTIGANCTLAGGVGVVGHVEICDNVHVTGMTMVTRSITQPGSYSSGTPMASTGDWKRSAVRFSQLESIQQRLVALEKQR
ncbi:MAG: UDP-3-O-(3-hydroxymyristoyl)glucosamine N-acyltransferase [Gammaproteobacteria bacterium]|nr:MAG: UDP-3-O-(3-hydroxymyristoyl)glucosamine N-acyltransferase [Gammaproteobacteria bacterium]RLA56413.1 MAG: UDP-3-O-(3-hydroxymyristoyl)glucosamine N-acyltransferase [Gammaproteobacteria bacterium]